MTTQLQTFEDVAYINEEPAGALIEEGEDIEKLKKIKEVTQRFLMVNNFDISDEPNFEDLSSDQFMDYIQEQNKENLILNKLDELNIDITFRSSMSNYYTHKENKNNKLFVFFLPEGKRKSNSVSFTDFKKFITLILKLDCCEGLLISKKNISSKSLEQVKQCNINPGSCENIYNIITYIDDEFIDVTKHAFTSKVMKIYRSGDETDKFSKDNKISITKLSRMLLDDPITKFYRGRVGDVFQQKRRNISKNNILEEQIIFRLVVPAVLKRS